MASVEQPLSGSDAYAKLDVDERRCLVLTHCAQDVWNRAGKDVNKVSLAFKEACEWRSDSHLESKVLGCGFQSVGVCFLNTNATKRPVMTATAKDSNSEVTYIAVVEPAQDPARVTNSTATIGSAAADASAGVSKPIEIDSVFTTDDVRRRLADPSKTRVVFCGEGKAAVSAQKLTCAVWKALAKADRRTTSPRLKCISIGCACLLPKDTHTHNMEAVFTSLMSTADEGLREWRRRELQPSTKQLTGVVGKHLAIINDCGNLSLAPMPHESVSSYHEQGLPPNESHLELYFRFYKSDTTARSNDAPTQPNWRLNGQCSLCGLECEVMKSSSADADDENYSE